MLTNISPLIRIVLIAAGLCLIYPGIVTDIIGIVVTAAVFVMEINMKRKGTPQQA